MPTLYPQIKFMKLTIPITITATLILALIYSCNCGPIMQKTRVQSTPPQMDSAWLQLPCNYTSATDTTKYPLLIFYHGKYEGYDYGNLSIMVPLGPPKFMADSLRFIFTVASKWYKFIVVCPQSQAGIRTPASTNEVINYMIAHYRIDTTRIYLTGLSTGAKSVLAYLTESQQNANRIAAAVPMSAANLDETQKSNLKYISNANVHTQIFCGDIDGAYNSNNRKYVDTINHYNPGLAIFTSYSGGHCCWNDIYDLSHAHYNPNIYEWMLQFHR